MSFKVVLVYDLLSFLVVIVFPFVSSFRYCKILIYIYVVFSNDI